MIQRIQSVWLFLAAFISGALFIFPLYNYELAGTVQQLKVSNDYLLLVLAALITILPLVTIFLFTNRKRQKSLIWISIIGVLAFIGAMLYQIQTLKTSIPPITNDNFVIPGPLLPIISIVLLFLAWKGIRNDEALIKSADRFR
jgi:FtsH-binding integral membrane protein